MLSLLLLLLLLFLLVIVLAYEVQNILNIYLWNSKSVGHEIRLTYRFIDTVMDNIFEKCFE